MRIMSVLLAGIFISSGLYGQSASKEGGHCEKKDKDGKVSDISASSKEECKKAGGKWSKNHSGDHGDHGHDAKGESQDHKH